MHNSIVEISKKTAKAGRVPIRLVLHEIHSDTSSYNKNGISWSRIYVENNLESVKSIPIVTQFIDEEKTIPLGGHGEMNTSDGDVYFENSLVVGAFENAYIDDNIEVNGKKISALVGEGYIYNQRFPKLVEYLQEQYENNIPVEGSVEICADKSKGNNKIIYDGGYKPKGRVPMVYQYSGHALLFGEPPADDSALMLELNSYRKKDRKKEGENKKMDIVNKSISIELNKLSYEDIATLVTRAFNKAIGNKSEYYYDYEYEIYRFYPETSEVVFKKWRDAGNYYMTTYKVENTTVTISDIVKVEEDWKPTSDSQPVEINIKHIKEIIKGGNKMEDLIREKDKKIEELTNQLSEVNAKNIELTSKVTELDSKVAELNSTIVEVNKTLEDTKKEKETLYTEVNSLREYKETKETEVKKAEVNAYFENEIPKNGFEQTEINSLKDYVEKCDLEGLKKAEADLIVKKFKESSKKEAETNSVNNNLFFNTKEEKIDDVEAGKLLFN